MAANSRTRERMAAQAAGSTGAAPCSALFEHGGNLIECGQRQVDQLGAGFQAPAAHQVESGLEIVREGGQPLEAEHGPGALDGVQAAEDAAHQFRIAGIFVQLKKRRFQLGQDLPRLLAEALLELLGITWNRL